MYVPLIDGKCIPGDGVKTGVINSWDKGDGKKCTDVGLSPYGTVRRNPGYILHKLGSRPINQFLVR